MNAFTQKALLNKLRDAKKRQKKNGFTLIELLITVVILGVLSAVAIPGFLAQKDKADIAAANAQGKALMTACKAALQEVPVARVAFNLQSTKTFGKVTWTPTITPTVSTNIGVPDKGCSSVTSGSATNQDYFLNVNTGEVTNTAKTGGAVDAS